MATPQERFRTKVQQMGRTNGGNLSTVNLAQIPLLQASFDDAIDEELYRNGLIVDLLTDICIDTAANQPSSGLVSGGDNSGVWWVVCVVPRTGDSPTIFESATTPAINYSAIYGPYGSYAEAAAKAAEVTPCPGSTSGVILETIPLGVGPSGGTSGSPADASVYVLRKTFRRIKIMGAIDLGTFCKRVTVCKGSCPKPTVRVCIPGSAFGFTEISATLTATVVSLGVPGFCDGAIGLSFPIEYRDDFSSETVKTFVGQYEGRFFGGNQDPTFKPRIAVNIQFVNENGLCIVQGAVSWVSYPPSTFGANCTGFVLPAVSVGWSLRSVDPILFEMSPTGPVGNLDIVITE
jgi:hypothetical protein